MNEWQQSFARKLESVRSATRDHFERLAGEFIWPVYEEMEGFLKNQGISPDVPADDPGSRSFRFAATEGAYVLVRFQSTGLEECEASAEFCLPSAEKPSPMRQRTRMADLDEEWTRSFFQRALDRFAEGLVHAMNERADLNLELASV